MVTAVSQMLQLPVFHLWKRHQTYCSYIWISSLEMNYDICVTLAYDVEFIVYNTSISLLSKFS